VRFRTFGAIHAALAYTAITLWTTWPLARGLTHDVAWDLGDPVLVIWALAWNCAQILAILGGDLSRVSSYFDANIFAPAPNTLAYSEHFVAQAIQILPVYALTGNAVLCYNLLYLATFVLSGLGAFLFVREITGSRAAAFTAGLLFAFAPYRFPQSSHLQVLSSQWMPFALYAFRRYFDTHRPRALAWAAVALVAQNLSCGYYLLYFSPFAAAYVLAEIAARGRWREVGVWRDLAVAAVAVAAATVPFYLPHLALRDAVPSTRTLAEVGRYSADAFSYLTAFPEQPIWGGMQWFPKPEGQLFPGVAALILAAVALWPRNADGAGAPKDVPPRKRDWRHVATIVSGVLAVLHLALFFVLLGARRIVVDLGAVTVRASDATQLLLRAVVLGAAILGLSAGARARAKAFLWPHGAFLVALLAAMWLSLGPSPTSMGRPLDLAAPYRVLYDVVPGFDGVRAPARFWMIGLLALSVLGGLGAARLAGRPAGIAVIALTWWVCLAEARLDTFVVNGAGPVAGFNAPEPRLRSRGDAPPVYAAVAKQPADAVLAELPLGLPDFDLRAMYYSTLHWRRLVNGYSGFTPTHYGRLVAALGRPTASAGDAWEALMSSSATLVLVHEAAYPGEAGTRLTDGLRERGARELARDGVDVLLALPAPSSPAP
jgi:hypothetical protein